MEDKTNPDNKEYANMTHFIAGLTHEQPVGGWRFIHGHTFCMGRKVEEMRSLKEVGLDETARELVVEARAVDKMFKSGPLS